MTTHRIKPRELSSRKLWQLAETRSEEPISAEDLAAVIAELARRRQDLERLEAIMQPGESTAG